MVALERPTLGTMGTFCSQLNAEEKQVLRELWKVAIKQGMQEGGTAADYVASGLLMKANPCPEVR
jgi:hypothetical protein